MAKKVRVLSTLEDVGSKGKFFNDSTLMKCAAIFVIGIMICLFIAGQLSFILPTYISLPIGIVISIPLLFKCCDKFILKGKELYRIEKEKTDDGLVDCKTYSDIYRIDSNNICYHSDGNMSIFLEVDRLTTIDMKESDINDFFNCYANFENAILNSNFNVSYKYYELEDLDTFRDAVNYQNTRTKSITNKSVNITTLARNHYIDKYSKVYGSDCLCVYVFYCKFNSPELFKSLIKNNLVLLNNSHLGNIHFMGEAEINKFGSMYFNTPYFNCINLGAEVDKDILIFEEDTL